MRCPEGPVPIRRQRAGAAGRLIVGLAALAGAAASCGGATVGPPPSRLVLEPGAVVGSRPPTQGPQANPDLQHQVRLNLVNGLLDNRPIFNGDFADPASIFVGGDAFVYASDTISAHVPVLEIADPSRGSSVYLGDALPTLPAWTASGMQWGPAVWRRPDGVYVLYYSTPDSHVSTSCLETAHRAHVTDGLCYVAWSQTTRQCISSAISSSPAGPFTDRSSAPLICPVSQGGAIDPSVFVTTAGRPYLLWKSDGNAYGIPTVIYSQPLAPDGQATVGPAQRLVGATQPWEGNLVEGPAMIEYRGVYWLFYSANNWNSTHYAIGVARCSSVSGPCRKILSHPWLSSTTPGQSQDQGPGGEEFAVFDGLVWMVHHGWLPGQAGTPDGERRLYVDLVEFPHGIPQLAAPALGATLADLVYESQDPAASSNATAELHSLLAAGGVSSATLTDDRFLADGQTACRALAQHDSWATIESELQHRGLARFEADLVSGVAVERLCPAEEPAAEAALEEELGQRG